MRRWFTEPRTMVSSDHRSCGRSLIRGLLREAVRAYRISDGWIRRGQTGVRQTTDPVRRGLLPSCGGTPSCSCAAAAGRKTKPSLLKPKSSTDSPASSSTRSAPAASARASRSWRRPCPSSSAVPRFLLPYCNSKAAWLFSHTFHWHEALVDLSEYGRREEAAG